MVAQIDEQDAAMVADAVAPAGQPDGLADVIFAEGAAGVGTIAMHDGPGGSGIRDKGAKARAQGLAERRERGNLM